MSLGVFDHSKVCRVYHSEEGVLVVGILVVAVEVVVNVASCAVRASIAVAACAVWASITLIAHIVGGKIPVLTVWGHKAAAAWAVAAVAKKVALSVAK